MSAIFEDMMTGLDEVDAFLAGEKAGYKVTLPEDVDVKSIRKRLNMTQARFSDTFGFSLDAVKHWEGGRRTPESSARAFLTVIAKNPTAVISALHPAQTMVARKSSGPSTNKAKSKRRPPMKTASARGIEAQSISSRQSSI
jgi:putative transcriptional regulator